MTMAQVEDDERAELMARLRGIATKRTADAYEGAPLIDLRRIVASGEAQRRFYAECGFEDMAAAKTPS
jgi:hypothetical protein